MLLLHLRLFPRPLSNHATVCSRGLGCCFKSVQTSDCTDRLAHAWHGSFQPELLSMLSCEIWDWSNIYFNIFWYSDWTMLLSRRSVYDVSPLWLSSLCWHGKWLRDQETPCCTTWFDTPTGQHGIWNNILYTWFSHFTLTNTSVLELYPVVVFQ